MVIEDWWIAKGFIIQYLGLVMSSCVPVDCGVTLMDATTARITLCELVGLEKIAVQEV